MSIIKEMYDSRCNQISDINKLLPILKGYALQCETITEFGVRQVVSTYAFLSAKPKKMVSFDIYTDQNINQAIEGAKEENIDFKFIQQDVLSADIEKTDLLFIDTIHTYKQLSQELQKHALKVSKYIIMHDTKTFGMKDEYKQDTEKKGLQPAIEEFLNQHLEWKKVYETEESNGLTILQRINGNKTTEDNSLISIVIPTYNHCEDLLKPCLESIKKNSDLSKIEVIVVSNGSRDKTREYVKSLGEPFKLLWFEEGLGYTKATNEGIKIAKGEYIVLLNNDTVILDSWPKQQWLECLKAPLSDLNVGITGVKRHFSVETNAYFLIFFCVMIPRRIFNNFGLLDETFNPGGGEDIDFCIKLENAGYKVVRVCSDTFELNWQTSFPIYHKAEGTMHDAEHIKEWTSIFEGNGKKINERYKDRLAKAAKVGIVMPAFNAEKTIEISIKGVQSQWYTNWVLFVCDNNSTDNTKNICQKYLSDERIKYLFYDKEQGPAQARNYILEQIRKDSSIDYVAYCDADDVWLDQHLTKQILPLIINADMVYSEPSFISEDGKPQTPFGIPQYPVFNANNFAKSNFIWISTVIHKKKCLDIGNFDPIVNSIEDWDYWWRLSDAGYSILHNFYNNTVIYTVKTIGMASQSSAEKYDIIRNKHGIKSYSKNIQFLKEQNSAVFKEIFEENNYNIKVEDVKDFNVLDIGANRGMTSIFFSILGAKSILAVEANPVTFKDLTKNITDFKNVTAINKAIFNKSDEIVYLANPDAWCMITKEKTENSISTITLKDLLKNFDSSDSNLILKMDIEGSEFDALLYAAGDDIRRFKLIFIEIHGDKFTPDQPDRLTNNLLENYICALGFKKIHHHGVGWFAWNYDENGNKVNVHNLPQVYKFVRE